EPYLGATGNKTTLTDTIFSTVPGAPVYVGKSARYRSRVGIKAQEWQYTQHLRPRGHGWFQRFPPCCSVSRSPWVWGRSLLCCVGLVSWAPSSPPCTTSRW